MRLLSCPKSESLLELVSVPDEMPVVRRFGLKAHMLGCSGCRDSAAAIREKVDAYFRPQPDITSSLLKVYSRLKQDETLVLKGWKLGDIPSRRKPSVTERLVREGWLFRGALAMSVLVLVMTVVLAQRGPVEAPATVAEKRPSVMSSDIPLAQIRVEDRNAVRVHYVQPELLQSVEFETTSAR